MKKLKEKIINDLTSMGDEDSDPATKIAFLLSVAVVNMHFDTVIKKINLIPNQHLTTKKNES